MQKAQHYALSVKFEKDLSTKKKQQANETLLNFNWRRAKNA